MSTYYVTQSGAGTQDGTLGNEWSVTNVNNVSNWSATPGTAGKISPGDTVTLTGTFTSQIVIAGSGTSGNLITFTFASGAKFSKTAWICSYPGPTQAPFYVGTPTGLFVP